MENEYCHLDVFPSKPVFPGATWINARIEIDGISLINLVRDYEKTIVPENESNLAGSYDFLELRSLQAHLYVASVKRKTAINVLGCGCGEEEGWPLETVVYSFSDCIEWRDFRQPHREAWNYSGFGPFVFERWQYHDVLCKLCRWVQVDPGIETAPSIGQ